MCWGFFKENLSITQNQKLRIWKQLAYIVMKCRNFFRSLLSVSTAKISKCLGLKHLLVLAAETNIFNVFRKPSLWQDISEAILLFFLQKSPLLSYKCVSIQSSIWILSRAQLRYSSTAGTLLSVHQPAAMRLLSARKYSSWVVNTYTFIAPKVTIFAEKNSTIAWLMLSLIHIWRCRRRG